MKIGLLSLAWSFGIWLGFFDACGGDVAWEQEFVFMALPSELDPHWTRMGEASSQVIEKDGGDVLVVKSSTLGGTFWLYADRGGGWNATEPTTVEFRVRVTEVDTGSEAGAEINLKNEDDVFVFKLTNSEFKTFRIVLENGEATVYDMETFEEVKVLRGQRMDRGVHPDSDLHPNSIGFGDYSSAIGGTSEWKFLRWTNRGAFRPSN